MDLADNKSCGFRRERKLWISQKAKVMDLQRAKTMDFAESESCGYCRKQKFWIPQEAKMMDCAEGDSCGFRGRGVNSCRRLLAEIALCSIGRAS